MTPETYTGSMRLDPRGGPARLTKSLDCRRLKEVFGNGKVREEAFRQRNCQLAIQGDVVMVPFVRGNRLDIFNVDQEAFMALKETWRRLAGDVF